ncbi:hypothetical protein BN969_12930 [Staphylococcus aureus]|nr:hypothetical protein BN969_12930 [Staphylococcus aureus]
MAKRSIGMVLVPEYSDNKKKEKSQNNNNIEYEFHRISLT